MYEYRAYVCKVYDGDTVTADIDLGFGVILRKQKLRLAGINAPKVRGESRPMGLISRDHLRMKIGNKQVIIRTTKDKQSKYGMWLADIILDGNSINDWLLAEGLAETYTK
jgi:micrococcal nuclease